MSWMLWALGTLGFGGIVTFCVTAPIRSPIVAAAIGKGVLAVGRWLLGSRIGCALLAGVLVFFATWMWRDVVVDDRWQAKWSDAKLSAERARQHRDSEVARELGDKYGPVIAQLKSTNSKLQKQVETYAKRKPVPAGGPCHVGPDAVRMRQPLH